MMIGELEVVVVPEIPGQLHPEQRSLYQVDIVSKAVSKARMRTVAGVRDDREALPCQLSPAQHRQWCSASNSDLR